ncbi:MAG: MFS transporter [Vulcanimicrobiaceae bacterium]|jgi:FSR family fosmidomycin resistance protein-like MFS transporter
MTRFDPRAMALLATAHVVDDINQSFIPALLPILRADLGLSYAAVTVLVAAQAMSSSVIQPAIGILADRRSMPWLIAAGIFLAGGGVAALGVLTFLPLLVLAALISGIGVACFHPEAARFANYVSGDKKASGMRWFTAGGNVGFAIGPIFATAALAAWGLRGTLVAAIPVTIVAAVVLLELRRLSSFVPAHARTRTSVGRDDWGSFWKLSAYVVVRSMAYIGSVSFIPLYFVGALHASPALGDGVLTAFLLFGVAGTIAGGPIADHVGRKPVLVWSTGLTAVCFTVLVALTHGGGLWLAIAILLPTGFIFVAAQASFVVLGQEYLPNHLGLASGVTLGLAVSLGGMFTPVLGAIADHAGVAASVLTIGGLALVALILALILPTEAPRHVGTAEAVA